ncbi:hypothetical protein IK110_03205 [Candidatus Saccharibacteria bacterium]|nr:hypothetical protein [Candidatus Saccharibacteria bacterium]
MEEIFCFVDEMLPRNLIKVTEQTIHDAGVIYHNTPAIFAGSEPIKGVSGSFFTKAGTVVRNNEFGIQRNADQILSEVQKNLFKRGRRIIFITVDDLTCNCQGNFLNFCFGEARGFSVVISMTRFRSLPPKEQEIILAGLIMHELGHLYDVAGDKSRAKTQDKLGMHCTDKVCVMQQGMSMEEIRENFLFVEKLTRHVGDVKLKYYCPLCMKDVHKYFEPKKESTPNSLPPLPPRRKAG